MTRSTSAHERRALVRLHHLRRCDSIQLWKLLEQYGSAYTALKQAPVQQTFGDIPDASQPPDDPFAVLAKVGAKPITWLDDDYPALMMRDKHPPPVLYVQGSLVPEDTCAVAIVGSRRATRWAKRLAYELARDLAAMGVTIVSGMAAGVDMAAHEGALSTGRTIAVVGTGIDRTYPAQHVSLQARIAKQGAVVSQFPCGTEPKGFHFPLRNDTIVRLSLGVVVVEAPESSGAIITAHKALDRNVEVMVCPGDAGRPSCRGSNRLLKEKGTAMVENAMDVLEALRLESRLFGLKSSQDQEQEQRHPALPAWVTSEPTSIEELAERASEPVGKVRARLTELELMGLVVRLEGDRYRVVGTRSGEGVPRSLA